MCELYKKNVLKASFVHVSPFAGTRTTAVVLNLHDVVQCAIICTVFWAMIRCAANLWDHLHDRHNEKHTSPITQLKLQSRTFLNE